MIKYLIAEIIHMSANLDHTVKVFDSALLRENMKNGQLRESIQKKHF